MNADTMLTELAGMMRYQRAIAHGQTAYEIAVALARLPAAQQRETAVEMLRRQNRGNLTPEQLIRRAKLIAAGPAGVKVNDANHLFMATYYGTDENVWERVDVELTGETAKQLADTVRAACKDVEEREAKMPEHLRHSTLRGKIPDDVLIELDRLNMEAGEPLCDDCHCHHAPKDHGKNTRH